MYIWEKEDKTTKIKDKKNNLFDINLFSISPKTNNKIAISKKSMINYMYIFVIRDFTLRGYIDKLNSFKNTQSQENFNYL